MYEECAAAVLRAVVDVVVAAKHHVEVSTNAVMRAWRGVCGAGSRHPYGSELLSQSVRLARM